MRGSRAGRLRLPALAVPLLGACVDISEPVRAQTSDTQGTTSTTTSSALPTVCGEAVTVPAGWFWMGCLHSMNPPCGEDELPYHEVHLSEFRIDDCEVTVAEYRACVEDGACAVPLESELCNYAAGLDVHPVNCVTAEQAAAYCAWNGGALPTEAQWEYAARGGDRRVFPWGDDAGDYCNRAVLKGCDGGGATWPVGTHPEGASAHGVEDMAGNVAEWVADPYAEDYYGQSPAEDPSGPATGSLGVLRGGGYDSVLGEARTHTRRATSLDYVWFPAGFRCAYASDGGGTDTSSTATTSASTTGTSDISSTGTGDTSSTGTGDTTTTSAGTSGSTGSSDSSAPTSGTDGSGSGTTTTGTRTSSASATTTR